MSKAKKSNGGHPANNPRYAAKGTSVVKVIVDRMVARAEATAKARDAETAKGNVGPLHKPWRQIK